MDDAIGIIYTSKEVSVSVGIASSTLRTWCLKLEAEGYPLRRSDDGKRMFFERDITALRTMKELLDKKHSMEYAVGQIVSKYNTKTHSVTDDDGDKGSAIISADPSSERFPSPAEFMQEIRRAIREEVHQEVAAAIEEQNKRLEEHIDRRDRQLMEVLRELQQSRKEQEMRLLKVEKSGGRSYLRGESKWLIGKHWNRIKKCRNSMIL